MLHTPFHTDRDRLTALVEAETARLNRTQGAHNAPFGGWRNHALATIAEQELMNPYALDHIVRAATPRQTPEEHCHGTLVVPLGKAR